MEPPDPWYREGLSFACTQCGKCCHSHGEYSHVYVNARERRTIAAHLGLNTAVFTRRYTVQTEEGYRSLRFEDEACVFLEGKICTIHAVKPIQCRTWPFWSELLESPETYAREVLAFCPGSRSGSKVGWESIRRQARETDAALDEEP